MASQRRQPSSSWASDGVLKIHVHTDDPAEVLAYATGLGEVAEVHINNMRRRPQERAAGIAARGRAADGPRKPVGFVAVAVGRRASSASSRASASTSS